MLLYSNHLADGSLNVYGLVLAHWADDSKALVPLTEFVISTLHGALHRLESQTSSS